jgi:hypothetical protein
MAEPRTNIVVNLQTLSPAIASANGDEKMYEMTHVRGLK